MLMMINWLIISELHGLTAGRQLVNDSVFFSVKSRLTGEGNGISNNTTVADSAN